MDRYSAWTTSYIQNKETATHERYTECREIPSIRTKKLQHMKEIPSVELTYVGRVLVLGCEVTKNHKVWIDSGRNG